MMIYITSHLRADRVKTLEFISPTWRMHTRVVVYDYEVDEYAKYIPKDMIIACGEKVGLSKKRDWVLDNSVDVKFLLLDDDMGFSVRDSELKLKKATHTDVDSMFELLDYWLTEYAHVGVSQRMGNNRVIDDHVDVARMTNVMAFRQDICHDVGFRFGIIPVMSDFHAVLSLLEAGFPNRVSYKYAYNQGRSGDSGGVSEYRTYDVIKEGALTLARLHPGVVRVVAKKSKADWDNIGKVRTDVNISWKKAYKQKPATGGIRAFLR